MGGVRESFMKKAGLGLVLKNQGERLIEKFWVTYNSCPDSPCWEWLPSPWVSCWPPLGLFTLNKWSGALSTRGK